MTSPAESVAILVLGPPRSGTSAVSQFLNHCGFDFGDPAHFIDTEVHKHNPIFFELEWVNQVNDAVLERFGAGFKSGWPPPAPEYAAADLHALRDRAKGLVTAEWPRGGRIGIKDPRFCFTLPFWRGVLADLGFRVSLVWSLRSPAATIASNARLVPGWSMRRLCEFWTRCVLAGRHVVGTDPCPLLDYDWMTADPAAFATDAIGRLGLEIADAEATVRHVSRSHRHETADRMAEFPEVDELDARFRTGGVSADEYPASRRLARLLNADAELEEQARRIQSSGDEFDRLSRERIELIHSLQGELADRESLLSEQRRQSSELVASQEAHIEKLTALYREAEQRRAALDQEVRQWLGAAESARHHIGKLESEYGRMAGLAESRAEHIVKLEAAYGEVARARAALEHELQALRTLTGEQTRQAEALHESQRLHIAKLEAEYSRTEEERAWLAHEAPRLRAEIASLASEAEAREGRLADLRNELAHRSALLLDFADWVAERKKRTLSIEVGGLVDGVNRLLRRRAA